MASHDPLKTRILERYQEGIMHFLFLFRLRRAKKKCFFALQKLLTMQFLGFLNAEYLKHPAFYEKSLNKWRCYFLKHLQSLRKLSIGEYQQIDKLHEVTCSMHLLTLRVTDQTVFEICRREMQVIEKAATRILLALSKNKKSDTQELLDEILMFEGLFSKTLQIVMNDPVVFLFFILDLYAFHSIVSDLSKQ